jgi:hypothetical protein
LVPWGPAVVAPRRSVLGLNGLQLDGDLVTWPKAQADGATLDRAYLHERGPTPTTPGPTFPDTAVQGA